MRATHRVQPRAERHMSTSVTRGVTVGLIGGLLGTVVMDLFGAGLFLMLGGPASLSFAIIGNAAAGFFSIVGIALTGGPPLGALLHYGIGLGFGGIFGAAVSQLAPLRVGSLGKGMGLSVLYIEVISQPLLVAAALILQMTPSEAAQWFGLSFLMHLVYGLVLGIVVGYGLGPAFQAGPAGSHDRES